MSPPATSGERRRDALLVVLATGTGAVDATSFERLGHVFGSVMTGNLVLLGIGVGSADGRVALAAGCAMVAYLLAVLLAAPHRDGTEDELLWPRRATACLLADLALLVIFTAGWEIDGAHPARLFQLLLLADVSGAMGLQAAAVRQIGQVSTTYLTSTLTGVIEAFARLRLTGAELRSLAILLAALTGAAITVVLIDDARRASPAPVLLPLCLVLLAAPRLSGVRAAGRS